MRDHRVGSRGSGAYIGLRYGPHVFKERVTLVTRQGRSSGHLPTQSPLYSRDENRRNKAKKPLGLGKRKPELAMGDFPTNRRAIAVDTDYPQPCAMLSASKPLGAPDDHRLRTSVSNAARIRGTMGEPGTCCEVTGWGCTESAAKGGPGQVQSL
jgi:hypothetical protein